MPYHLHKYGHVQTALCMQLHVYLPEAAHPATGTVRGVLEDELDQYLGNQSRIWIDSGVLTCCPAAICPCSTGTRSCHSTCHVPMACSIQLTSNCTMGELPTCFLYLQSDVVRGLPASMLI